MTVRQKKAILALLASPTKAAAAQAAGISARTLRGYLQDPAFREALKAAQRESLENAVDQSRRNLSGALGALDDIATDAEQPAAARVSAARSTIEMHLKLVETVDILQELDRLESWRREATKNGD